MDRIHRILNDLNRTLSIQKDKSNPKLQSGDKVKNINRSCMHYGSEGIVESVKELPRNIGYIVAYTTTNSGKTWSMNQTLEKTEDQLQKLGSHAAEEETKEELNEYKNDFLEMNIGSLKAIMTHAQQILNSLNQEPIRENLTESWLQGKIAITEDYMRTIHDFVMYVSESDDTISASDKPGLWENIRKKREREGKKYKPAKPGDKDRPNPEQWKELTNGKTCAECGLAMENCKCEKANVVLDIQEDDIEPTAE